MTEDEAQVWVEATFGSDARQRIAVFVDAVVAENDRQNMIARSTITSIWQRHVVDSAQLVPLAEHADRLWVDIGTGAGFPGMIVALIRQAPTVLIEPRRRRAAFLDEFARSSGIAHYVSVAAQRAESVAPPQPRAATISARAVASADSIFTISRHLADADTRYILHRGRSFRDDLENAAIGWHGMFHVEHSLTDPQSGILVATQVRPR